MRPEESALSLSGSSEVANLNSLIGLPPRTVLAALNRDGDVLRPKDNPSGMVILECSPRR